MHIIPAVVFVLATCFFEAPLRSLFQKLNEAYKEFFGFLIPEVFISVFFSWWFITSILVVGAVLQVISSRQG